MNSVIRVALQTTPDMAQRLQALQQAFAEVCNALMPMVLQTRCWNRVALHHMAYRPLREQFPGLGSQMICNAIYSVSRTCRRVYQHPGSAYNLTRWRGKALPRIRFLPEAPVYFDRHTLSIKDGQVSMFTLDGRLRFRLDLSPENEQRFRDERLREIALTVDAGAYVLTFQFSTPDDDADTGPELPEYVLITEAEEATAPIGAAADAHHAREPLPARPHP